MPEPSTHYQLSFTSRQAMALFVGLLLALGLAYFLGLMTGLSGRESPKAAVAATPAPTPQPTEPERIARAAAASPTAIRPNRMTTTTIPPFPKPVLGREPTAAPRLQFFEDGGGPEATPSPKAATPRTTALRPKPSPSAISSAGEFWVQVTSGSSEREARAWRDKLIHRGYRARILVAEGPKGKIYRVRVGPFSSRDEASRTSDRVSRGEKVKTWIVPAGK